jgi:hypothetical protein
MIGPPGLPKFGRRILRFAGRRRARRPLPRQALKWAAGLYLAGVVAHFSDHMAFNLSLGINPTFDDALASAPTSLVWPADLIGTLLDLS